jgi:hypothetical protein
MQIQNLLKSISYRELGTLEYLSHPGESRGVVARDKIKSPLHGLHTFDEIPDIQSLAGRPESGGCTPPKCPVF